MLRALPKVRHREMSGLSPNATRVLGLTQLGLPELTPAYRRCALARQMPVEKNGFTTATTLRQGARLSIPQARSLRGDTCDGGSSLPCSEQP